MAFGLDEKIITADLRKHGHKCEKSNYRSNSILVDDRFEFCCSNCFYFHAGGEKSIGRGRQQFIDMLERNDENV